MHKIKIVGVRTLETSKFDGETGEMENPCKATLKWDRSVKLTEAGLYNNMDTIIMSQAEYEALTSGKEGYIMPDTVRQALITAINVMKDLLEEK